MADDPGELVLRNGSRIRLGGGGGPWRSSGGVMVFNVGGRLFRFDVSAIESDPLCNTERAKAQIHKLPPNLRAAGAALVYDYWESKGYVRSD